MKSRENQKKNERIQEIETITLEIQGITCSSCVTHIKNALEAMEGVLAINIPGWQKRTGIIQTTREVNNGDIKKAIAKVGYQAKITAREKITPQKKQFASLKFFDYELVVIGTSGTGMACGNKRCRAGFSRCYN